MSRRVSISMDAAEDIARGLARIPSFSTRFSFLELRRAMEPKSKARRPSGGRPCGGCEKCLQGDALHCSDWRYPSRKPSKEEKREHRVAGDRLWVRETWAKPGEVGDHTEYRADNPDPLGAKWRPSIHMPRWASRLTLEVVSVRVQRLQDMTPLDAGREGIRIVGRGHGEMPIYGVSAGPNSAWLSPLEAFSKLWDSINSKRASWGSNPWVWAVEFKRVESSPRLAEEMERRR